MSNVPSTPHASGESQYIPPPIYENPKPVIKNCEIGKVSDSAPNLAKLQACRDAVKCYADIVNTNNEIVQYNDRQDLLLKDAIASWEIQKQTFNNTVVADWKNRRDSNLNSLHSYRKGGTCTSWPEIAKCPGDNLEKIGEKTCNISTIKEAKCKYTSAYIASQMSQWDQLNPMPVFSVPIPNRTNYPLMQQNETEGIIQCCSNYINITGDPTDVQQKCMQEINNLEQTIINVPKTPSNIDKIIGEESSSTPVNENKTDPDKTNTNDSDIYMYTGIGLGVLFLIIILGIIIFYVLRNKTKSE